ncbi:MAG: hypothetical protein GC139_09350 [Sideroxydans sp.]|nr:hypothetical protein [Sideroxydans sp.]
MFGTPFLAASVSYLLMLAAYYLPRHRYFHIPVMISCILFDAGMPIYLYTHRHWWRRLIDHQEILSSLVWMHFCLLMVLYVLYAVQVLSARKMLRGDPEARLSHHGQGKAMLIVRALTILSGAMLATPTP